jgi:hypothetical protein
MKEHRMVSERLKQAKDLIVRNEYEDLDGGRRLSALVYSSKILGLTKREGIDMLTGEPEAEPQTGKSEGSARRGPRGAAAARDAASEEKKE